MDARATLLRSTLLGLVVLLLTLGACGSTQPPPPTQDEPAPDHRQTVLPAPPPPLSGHDPTRATPPAPTQPPASGGTSPSKTGTPSEGPPYPNERFPGQCAQAAAELQGPPPPPPKRERDADNACQADADCEVAPLGHCRCPPVGYQWHYALNRPAAERIRNLWARRKCRQPVCPGCPGRHLGEEVKCVAGQCVVR